MNQLELFTTVIAQLNIPDVRAEDIPEVAKAFLTLARYHMQWAELAKRAEEWLDLAEANLKGPRPSDSLPLLSQATSYYILLRRKALQTSSDIILERAYKVHRRLRIIENSLTQH